MIHKIMLGFQILTEFLSEPVVSTWDTKSIWQIRFVLDGTHFRVYGSFERSYFILTVSSGSFLKRCSVHAVTIMISSVRLWMWRLHCSSVFGKECHRIQSFTSKLWKWTCDTLNPQKKKKTWTQTPNQNRCFNSPQCLKLHLFRVVEKDTSPRRGNSDVVWGI